MNPLNRRSFLKTGLGALAGSALVTSCRTPRPAHADRMIFPGAEWMRGQPETVGMDGAALDSARAATLRAAWEAPHSAVIIRYGRLVAEWYQNTTPEKQQPMASVCKSVFCSMLGIAVAEGRIRSLDDKVVEYYPEFLECAGDQGANPKQYVTEKDRAVTFRQIAAGAFSRPPVQVPSGPKTLCRRTMRVAMPPSAACAWQSCSLTSFSHP